MSQSKTALALNTQVHDELTGGVRHPRFDGGLDKGPWNRSKGLVNLLHILRNLIVNASKRVTGRGRLPKGKIQQTKRAASEERTGGDEAGAAPPSTPCNDQ
eukprot:4595795-Prorocentrum_lima.AAC.1